MSTVISKFSLVPNFYGGFEFLWEVDSTFSDPFPWQFYVEESRTPSGDFTALSPAITNLFRWKEKEPRLISMDNSRYFRIKLTTPRATYISYEIAQHTALDRQSFLYLREIMRKELLHQKNLAGIEVDVWLRASFGPYCDCVDPITKDVLTTRCPKCFGIGRTPGYHGPYNTWAILTPMQKVKEFRDDNTEPVPNYGVSSGRLIAVPELKTNDIVIDNTTDRRYYITGVQELVSLRRIPIVQDIKLNLIPVSDSAYMVGVV